MEFILGQVEAGMTQLIKAVMGLRAETPDPWPFPCCCKVAAAVFKAVRETVFV